jgi:hypothetical protein
MVLKNLHFEQNILDIRIAEVQSLNSFSETQKIQDMQLIENPEFLVLKDLPLSFKQ